MASFFLEVAFRLEKPTAKLLNDAFYAMFYCQIKMLSLYRPGALPGCCFVGQRALTNQVRWFQMQAHHKNKQNHPPLRRTFAHGLLLLTLLLAFLGTIDGPAAKFGVDGGSVVSQTAKVLDRKEGVESTPLWIGVLPKEPPPLHPSFLLCDLKQNLRRWPNVASDISRSPPSLFAI